MNLKPPHSVLFIRLRLLGDIIMTIPALLRFRQVYPDAVVYYALEEPFAQLADLLPVVDECFVIPRNFSLKDYGNFGKNFQHTEDLRYRILAGESLSGARITGADLSGMDLRDYLLEKTVL